MPRAGLMLLPLVLTPMGLQFLVQRSWETRLRREIRHTLQLRRDLGSSLGGPNPAVSVNASPYRVVVAEGAAQVVMGAFKPAHRGPRQEFSLVGCLDQTNGDIEVQERFSAPAPSLCRMSALEHALTAMGQ